ncbi:uncharacterized protein LOC110854670 [Folsomia candida]|uniref:Gamma-crystallin B n=1 Tax=Folsomia candida TaxID=158441 RepID=A0A226DW09_FOLCA|nr:uncharacterized protein LOC110854670 [Folsomia candida]OXA49652.1 Gamma-crystallin B [Folsomia candida]
MKLIFLLPTLIVGCVAVQNSITIYNSTDQQGESITFTEKLADLSPWRSFLDSAQSFCATGVWMLYNQRNFEVSQFWFENKCGNYLRFHLGNSIRFPGLSDTDAASTLSFFNGTFLSPWSGLEKLVVADSDSAVGFAATWIMVMGSSNWTLYSAENFQGEETCIFEKDGGARGWYELDTRGRQVNSVRRGCN